MSKDTRETPAGTVHVGYVNAKYSATEAVSPSKSKEFPGRWDLTLIGRTDNRESDVQGSFNGFTVGITFTPPQGWILRLHDAPTLKTMGYSLMGPVDVPMTDDPSELIVNLYKLDDNQDIDTPFVAVTVELVRNIIFHIPSDPRQNEGAASIRRRPAKSKGGRAIKPLIEEDEEEPRSLRPAKRRTIAY
jgi:hypothetical protein